MPAGLRPYRHQRNRKARAVRTDAIVPGFVYLDPVVTITLPMPITLKGIPQFVLSTGELPASAAWVDANTVTLTYAVGGVITNITVPQRDPGIRDATGGFVTPGTFPLS